MQEKMGQVAFLEGQLLFREIKVSASRGGKSRKCCLNKHREKICNICRKKRKMRK